MLRTDRGGTPEELLNLLKLLNNSHEKKRMDISGRTEIQAIFRCGMESIICRSDGKILNKCLTWRPIYVMICLKPLLSRAYKTLY